MSRRIRHGYAPTTGLSETRKKDRREMVDALAELCKEHGVEHTVVYEGDIAYDVVSKETRITLQSEDDLCVTVDFDSKSIQPNIFVLSWHFGFNKEMRDRRINPAVFHDHNNCHFRKATDVAHGWEQLKRLVSRRLKQIQEGKATVATKDIPQLA